MRQLRRGEVIERYIQLGEYMNRRKNRANKPNKAFWDRLMESNDRRLKRELREECERYGEEIVETAKRLRAKAQPDSV
jgi:hypothetical protein